MWNQTTIDLGKVKARVKQTVTFINTNIIVDLNPVSNAPLIRASCGCSVPQWDQSTGILTIIFTPQPVPIHIKQQGGSAYTASKLIYVTHDGGITDTLTIQSYITD